MTDDLIPARAPAPQLWRFARGYARVALAAAFLSAVASRLGVWGKSSFAAFERYTAEVCSFAPAAMIPFLARAATVLEVGFAIALLVGYQLRWVGFGAAVLLAMFGAAMAISFGPQSPLDYSVFSASACAVLVAVTAERPRSATAASPARRPS